MSASVGISAWCLGWSILRASWGGAERSSDFRLLDAHDQWGLSGFLSVSLRFLLVAVVGGHFDGQLLLDDLVPLLRRQLVDRIPVLLAVQSRHLDLSESNQGPARHYSRCGVSGGGGNRPHLDPILAEHRLSGGLHLYLQSIARLCIHCRTAPESRRGCL